MRNRTGTSNINRRKYIKKASVSQPSSKPSSQPSFPNIVPASKTVSSAGLVVAAPGAAERVQGKRPVSSDITGREIQVDEEGRMKLDEIEKKNFIEQLVRGSVVPTEQMVGIVKDVAYGVKSEDQRSMESGLDLVLNPLMKPFVDERMKTEGVISDEWYWPEELKSTWNVLPGFMQKSDTVEKRSFFDGVGANVGNIGAISQSPLADAIRDEEFAVSGERFERAPGYYIGSALGEIPYFIIGAGQVKAVGTVAAKATAGVARGSGVVNTARVVSTAYKIERVTDKLQKVANKADNYVGTKVTTKPEVLKAVKLLKDGLGKNTAVQKQGVKDAQKIIDEDSLGMAGKKKYSPEEIENQRSNMKDSNEAIAFNRIKSNELDRFSNKAIQAIEKLPEKTDAQKIYKQIKVDRFNAAVQETLLPEMRKFKEGYVAQASRTARGSRAEKFAQFVEGSPKNASDKIDRFFNRQMQTAGDSKKTALELLKREAYDDLNAGKYSGVMGNIKLDRHLYGNVLTTAMGINRTSKKAKELSQLVSRTVPFMRNISRDELLTQDKSLREFVATKKKENVQIKAAIEKGKDTVTDKDGNTFDVNESLLKQNQDEIDAALTTIDENQTELQRAMSFTRTPKKDSTPETNVYRYDFGAIAKIMGKDINEIIPETIVKATKPSVGVRKVKGMWQGVVGDSIESSKAFWVSRIPRSQAITAYTEGAVSKSPSIFRNIGTRRVGRFRTIIPKKVEPMEDIIHFYEATDSIQTTSNKGITGATNIVMTDKLVPVQELNLIKRQLGLVEFKGDSSIAKALGSDENRRILEYERISLEDIEKIKDGQSPKTSTGADIREILINRAVLENKPQQANELLDEKIRITDMAISQIEPNKKLALEAVESNNKIKRKDSKAKAIKKIEKNAKEERQRLLDMSYRLGKDKKMSFNERRQKYIESQTHAVGNTKGTLFSMPLNVLKQEDMLLKDKYASSMIKDRKTNKEYYIGGDGTWYETKKGFRPSMVSQYKNVVHSTQERVYVQGGSYTMMPDGSDSYYLNNLFGTKSTTRKDTLKGTPAPDKTPEDRFAAQSNQINLGAPRIRKEFAPKDEGWDMSNQLNADMQDNLIILGDQDTYKGLITKLSPTEQKKLESGILGDMEVRVKTDMDSVNQGTPDIQEFDYVKKTDEQLLRENVKIVADKQLLKQAEGLQKARKKLRNFAKGERFVELRETDFTPDPTTLGQRSEISITRLEEGDAIWVSGADTRLSRLFGSTQSSQVTQPAIPPGVRVSPISDIMPVARLVDETASTRQEKNYGKSLQANKGTNYEIMYEQAETAGVAKEFKERTIELVYKKINNQRLPEADVMKKLLEPNSQLYRKKIINVLNDRNNAKFKTLNRRESIALKAKNKGRKKKEYVIDPNTAYKDIMDGGVDTRSPMKRAFDDLMDKSQVRQEPMAFMGDYKQYRPKETDANTTIKQPKLITRIFRSVGDKRKNKKNIVITEQANPFVIRALRELSQDEDLVLAAKSSSNKQIYNLFQQIGGASDTSFESSMQRIIKSQTDVKTTTLRNPLTGEPIIDSTGKARVVADTITDKRPMYSSDLEKIAKYDGFIEGKVFDKKTGKYIDNPDAAVVDKYKRAGQFEQGRETVRLGDESIPIRGSVSPDVEDTIIFKDTLKDTKDVLRSSIEDALGVRSGPVTSSDRKALATSIIRGFDDEFAKQRSKQQKNIWFGDDTISNLENWLGTEDAASRMSQPGMSKKIDSYQQMTQGKKQDTTTQSSTTGKTVMGMNTDKMFGRISTEQKPSSARQAVPATSLATSVGELFKPSETTAPEPEPFELSNPFAVQEAMAQPQPNAIDQAIGDVQKTLEEITTGNKKIGISSSGMTVKSYEAPSTLTNVIGRMDLSRNDIQEKSGQVTGTSLLDGLKLDQPMDTSTVVIPDFGTVLGLGYEAKTRVGQNQIFQLDTLPRLKTQQTIQQPVLPKPQEQRIIAPVIAFPMYNPVEAAKQRRSKIKKKKTKKTWWQTPENWYEPYYWGGKDQLGSGYVTFTGKEPGKVRKYEKRFFGIGVNDSPFGVRSKWF